MRAKSSPSNGKRSKARKPAAPKRRTRKLASKTDGTKDWRKSKEVAYVLNLFLDAYRDM
jgi:hypothetical protein